LDIAYISYILVPVKIYDNIEKDKKYIIQENKNKSGIYAFTNIKKIDSSKKKLSFVNLRDYHHPSHLNSSSYKFLAKTNSFNVKALTFYYYSTYLSKNKDSLNP
jgi:hypothetical protein